MAGIFTHRLGLNSAASGGDPHIGDTVLLLSMDGANGSTTFTDESPAAHGNATVVGNAQVSTTNPKFATGSLLLDGTTDSIGYNGHSDWNLGGDFTIDIWARFDAASLEQANTLVSRWDIAGNTRCWVFMYAGNAAPNDLRFMGSANGSAVSVVVSCSWTPTADTWYLLTAERSGTTFRLYIDGTMVAKATNAITFATFAAAALRIGDVESLNNDLDGKIDEVRITNAARYDSDAGFTPPDDPFPRT